MSMALSPAIPSATALALRGPVGSLDAYIDAVSRIPVQSREEEFALARRLKETGDLNAARELVLSHLRFVEIGRAHV